MSTSSEQEIPSASLLLVLSRFVSSIFNIDWAADVMVHVGVCYQELTVLRAFAVIAIHSLLGPARQSASQISRLRLASFDTTKCGQPGYEVPA